MSSIQKQPNQVIGFAKTLSVLLLIRTFFFSPHIIPSGSMYPTLEVGDYIVLSRAYYGYGKANVPLSAFSFKGRFFNKPPTRGEVVVFRVAKDDDADYIKRLVGLPGDAIQMIGGVLHINGKSVDLKRLPDYRYRDETGVTSVVAQFEETLPNGVKHRILKHEPFGRGYYDNTDVFYVPEGHYFMMGDNRDRSKDSRHMGVVGFVSEEALIGKPEFMFYSKKVFGKPPFFGWFMPWTWFQGVRPERFFQRIK
ncbi:MAG: signal peptidase I [Alphaproteobacteria bacterium]|nr:MAG: signal peptidase I [Alphaproteobacteria bacterium]